MKNRSNRALALVLALAMALTLGLTACGQQTETTDETSEETTAINVNYGISNSWDSLMPYYSVSGSNYSRLIYDKIYDRLAYVQADGTCTPRAATGWESADDGYSIVFTLNPDCAFHDGTPVTAQHWVDTIELVTDPACETLGRTTFAGVVGTDETGAQIEGETLGVEVLSDTSFKITFDHPVIPEEFLVENNQDIYVLPTYLLEDIAPEDMMTDDFWLAPVGSGPCSFVSELSGSNIVLAANKDYQLGAPGFDTLTITVMDKANLLTALISGDLDYYAFGGSISEDDRSVAEEAGFTVQESETPSSFYELMLNNESISDVDIRQAINKALDKELLCQQTAGTLGEVTSSSIMPGSDYAAPTETGTYDPQGATELLEASSYDGSTYTLACTSQRASTAALVQQDLAEIGINVEIVTADASTVFAGIFDGTYDMALASHTPNSLPLWFTGSRFSEDGNLFRVQDLSQYIELISAIQNETDETTRMDLVDEFEAYLNQEMPFVPLWFSRALRVESNTVTGIDYPSSSCCNENVWEWVKTEA